MFRKPRNNIFGCSGPWIILIVLVLTGCAPQKMPPGEEKGFLPEIRKLVVVGFRSYMSPGEEPTVVRNRITGAVFSAHPVGEEGQSTLTAKLVEGLLKENVYELVSPGQAKGAYLSILAAAPSMAEIEVFKKIGQAFSADAVLAGYVYRWVEREGTDYAVSRPASVAFDLYLMSAVDGATVWKGRFDKSQQSLSENLLDVDTFIRAGGKWMTAETLAGLGLADLLGKLPKPERQKTDK